MRRYAAPSDTLLSFDLPLQLTAIIYGSQRAVSSSKSSQRSALTALNVPNALEMLLSAPDDDDRNPLRFSKADHLARRSQFLPARKGVGV